MRSKYWPDKRTIRSPNKDLLMRGISPSAFVHNIDLSASFARHCYAHDKQRSLLLIF